MHEQSKNPKGFKHENERKTSKRKIMSIYRLFCYCYAYFIILFPEHFKFIMQILGKIMTDPQGVQYVRFNSWKNYPDTAHKGVKQSIFPLISSEHSIQILK
jgi:hypothetical protein